MDYAASGVDIGLEAKAVSSLISALGSSVREKGTYGAPMGASGGFSGLIEYGDDALAICTDGVGSKLVLAEMSNRWGGVGIDCMAMNVNDLLCCGAEPLAFVDYIATPEPNEEIHAALGASLSEAARLSRVTLCGGETASLPDLVNMIDLSGTALGRVPKKKVIETSKIGEGDVIIGLPSSGFHSNGYSLVRAVLNENKIDLYSSPPFAQKWLGRERSSSIDLIDILLEPTRIYVDPLVPLFNVLRENSNSVQWEDLHGVVHITGGGLLNLMRVSKHTWVIDNPIPPPPEATWLTEIGGIEGDEALRTFNMGMGMVLVVAQLSAPAIIDFVRNNGCPHAQIVGHILENGTSVEHPGLSTRMLETM